MPEFTRPQPQVAPNMTPEEVARELPRIVREVLNYMAQQDTAMEKRILRDPRFKDMRVAYGLRAQEQVIRLDFNKRMAPGAVLVIIPTQEGYQAAFVDPTEPFPDGGTVPVALHNLLSATHPDTLAAGVSRGSLIAGNSTPSWAELVIGAAGKVLYSDGTDAAWSDTLAEELTFLKSLILDGITPSQSTPTPARPGAGKVKVFADEGLGIAWLAIWPEFGKLQRVQGNFGNVCPRIIRPNVTTTMTTLGTSVSATGGANGTYSTPTVANTTYRTSQRRTQALSATGPASTCSIFEASLGPWIGNAAGLGGFYHCSRGVLGAASSSLGHYAFMGLRNSTTIMATTPLTATDLCGIAVDDGDANYHFIHNDNAGNAVKSDSGIAVGLPVMLEMAIAPNGSTMYFRLTRLDSDAVDQVEYSASSDLPRNTVFLAFHIYGNTNADATQPVTLDLSVAYTESPT